MTGDDRLVETFLRRRDEAAFRALYSRHTPVLYRIARRLLRDESEAEELVQETWVRAVERLDRFAGRSALRTWLIGIAINRARECRRERVPAEPASAAELSEPAAPDPGDRVDLERAIGCLPDGYREALVLHDIEGFSHREIADLLGIDTGTSRSQLHHARRAIRSLFRHTTTRPTPG